MGKWRVFALRAASSLTWGGWGFAVPFYFVQDCSSKMGLNWQLKETADHYLSSLTGEQRQQRG